MVLELMLYVKFCNLKEREKLPFAKYLLALWFDFIQGACFLISCSLVGLLLWFCSNVLNFMYPCAIFYY